jgi:membrane-bound lytic murein transglycosylase A
MRRSRFLFQLTCLAAVLALGACAPKPPPAPEPGPLRLTALTYGERLGWSNQDHRPAFSAFLRSCTRLAERAFDAPVGGPYAGTTADWQPVCAKAATVPQADDRAVRQFFESEFVPYRVSRGEVLEGLFTGYYEPELRGSYEQQGPYRTPLLGLPVNAPMPLPARAEIVAGALPQAQPLLYVDDPVDAFFLQIQGSGRVVMPDGSVVRAAYAGQNGHPYTAIGAILVQMGELTRETVSMQSIRAWMEAHPDRADWLMNQNASFVFFRVEPLGDPSLGAQGTQEVPLTPGASLAVDRSVHPLGVPLWLEATVPAADPAQRLQLLNRLLVAQDTGGAIRGPIRGDVYWGFGAEAAEIAGRMRSVGRLTVLLPRSVAARVGVRSDYPGIGV